jgi:peroxiredoxin
LPKLSLKTTEGENFNIQKLGKNNLAILSFWATWCGPCVKELDAINDVYENWKEKVKVEVFAVSIDDSKTSSRVNSLVNGKEWEFKVLLDPNHDLKRSLNVNTVPHLFIIKKGKIIYQHTGYTPGIEDELFEKLKELSK